MMMKALVCVESSYTADLFSQSRSSVTVTLELD